MLLLLHWSALLCFAFIEFPFWPTFPPLLPLSTCRSLSLFLSLFLCFAFACPLFLTAVVRVFKSVKSNCGHCQHPVNSVCVCKCECAQHNDKHLCLMPTWCKASVILFVLWRLTCPLPHLFFYCCFFCFSLVLLLPFSLSCSKNTSTTYSSHFSKYIFALSVSLSPPHSSLYLES